MSLATYIAKKLLASFPVLIGVTFLVFALMYISGDPVRIILREWATPELIESLRKELGLDQPFIVQYITWFSRVLRGEFGFSYVNRLPVSMLLRERIAPTILLTGTAFLISLGTGVLLGILMAIKHSTKLDTIISSIIVFFFSIPYFWLAIMFLWVFGAWLKLYSTTAQDLSSRLWLPVLSLVVPMSAGYAKLTRANMIEVFQQDYIRTARAKGLRERLVIVRHAMKNALLPIVALAILNVPWLLGGAVVTEYIFGWPGLGSLLVVSIYKSDFPVVQAVTFVITVLVIICNVLGDLLMAVLDPRLRVG
ncbi:MAG: ABC transporter permease [Desulfurococcaceae archaeon]